MYLHNNISHLLFHDLLILDIISITYIYPSRKGYVTVLGGQDFLHAYGLTPKAQIRRLGKFKVIQGTQVLIGKHIFLYLT